MDEMDKTQCLKSKKIKVKIAMNYSEFMEAVDEKLLTMSELEKTGEHRVAVLCVK